MRWNQNVTSDILTELEGAKTDAQNSGDSLGASIITGLQIGISSRKNNLISPVKNAMNTVISVANQALGIHSPSKVFKEMGEYTGEGFEHGFQDSMKEASETAKQIYTRFPGASFLTALFYFSKFPVSCWFSFFPFRILRRFFYYCCRRSRYGRKRDC